MCPQNKSRASRKISFEEPSEQRRPEVAHWVQDSFMTYFGVRPDELALVEESAGHFVQQFYKQHQGKEFILFNCSRESFLVDGFFF